MALMEPVSDDARARADDPVRSLAADIALLDDVLGTVARADEGERAISLHERIVGLSRAARDGDEGAAAALAHHVGALGPERLEVLIRSLTRWFQLENLAEDNERIRRLRAHSADPSRPRPGSLREAVGRLAEAGVGAAELARLLQRAELRFVLTAHPTEARRRTTIEKLARVFAVLRALDERAPTAASASDARRRLLATVEELWGSDELRAVSPTVLDEVRGGLVYFVTTLADVVPVVYRDLEEAIADAYPGAAVAVPPLLTFGSWIGGDRDGNPNVTPAITVQALELMRDQCLRFLEERVGLLAGRVSLSTKVVGEVHGLDTILREGEERFAEVAESVKELNADEPFRRAFTFMRERVRAAREQAPEGYGGPDELLADLRTCERALRASGGAFTAAGDLRDVIRQVEVFGFHFARLDIRENAKWHRSALHEILAELRVCEDYTALSQEQRMDLLCGLIADHRPVVPMDTSGFSAPTREVVETFRMLHGALSGAHRGAVETYVVSGTEGPADLIEVLLLMKEAALSRAGGAGARLRIVPLFEAGATLAAAHETMDAVLRRPEYRAALRGVGDEQEVMIGYSDSNKDVGYVASGWATYSAQVRLARTFAEHGVEWMFFHGRGGAVGRGGGPTSTAIRGLPPGTVGGRLKMTEQGEVLATKYSVGEIAHRELELAASAVLESALRAPRSRLLPDARRAQFATVMASMAARSERAYRELVHADPAFPGFFAAVTPLQEISRLQLGSRPARRPRAAGEGDVGIDDLRAIPWVFSWTQSRIALPAWYGLGTALAAARAEFGLPLLREMRSEWTFFAGLLSNAEMACAKADMGIAARYVALMEDSAARDRIWGEIAREFASTVSELLAVLDISRLLDRDPVLQASLDRRTPFVDPLSYVQIELLRRSRIDGAAADHALARTSLLTINGIAGGLRNTG